MKIIWNKVNKFMDLNISTFLSTNLQRGNEKPRWSATTFSGKEKFIDDKVLDMRACRICTEPPYLLTYHPRAVNFPMSFI